MSTVTVGFVPRERFSQAPEALQTILEATSVPFNLIVVDCNTPRLYWEPMEALLRGRLNVKVIRADRYLLPNQCRNLVLPEARDEFLCFIENDNLVEKGWLSRFLDAMEKHDADVVIPLLIEARPDDPWGGAKVHFDEGLGSIRSVDTPEGVKWEIIHREGSKDNDPGSASRPQQFMETHCLFFRKSIFNRAGLFDEKLNTSEEIDLSLSLYRANAKAVFAPECVVRYIQPRLPVYPEDRGYFSTKWDLERARRSHERIRTKWNLVRMPQLLGFVEERNRKGLDYLRLWRDELSAVLAPQELLILVDLEQFSGTEVTEGLHHLPFLEHDGKYWGAPEDDEMAIRELGRLRRSGAAVIAFSWNAFWWFDYYAGFYEYLRSRFRRILDNDHLVAFDLRAEISQIGG